MPYSVPPPPPLILNLPSSEEPSPGIIASSAISSATQSSPEFSRASAQQNETVSQTPIAQASLSRAESLGQPLQINPAIASSQPAQYGVAVISDLQRAAPAESAIGRSLRAAEPRRSAAAIAQAAPAESLPFPLDQPSPTLPQTSQPTPGGEILVIPEQPAPQSTPQPDTDQAPPSETPSPPSTPPANPAGSAPEVVELNADRQEYQEQQQVFTAEGNAVMRFRQAVLSADRIQVNLPNRIAVAEGNVTLTRGEQVLKGQRFEYNFVQGEGTVFGASGELDIPAAESDFSAAPPVDTGIVPEQSVGNRVNAAQPLQVTGSTGGITFGLSAGNQRSINGAGGQINRLRFEAERADFTPDGLVATNVRLTNDPFSPPELEIRTPLLTYSRLTQTSSELRARNPRVVFDQGFSLPLLRDRVVFDNRRRNPGLVQFGFDERDRGGLFIERTFEVLSTPTVQFSLTPQLLLQRSYDQGNFLTGSSFGLRSQISAVLSRNTTLSGEAVLTSLDLNDLEDNLRANASLRQRVGRYNVALGYTYRDRLFNGSLGFQNVQQSFGLVVQSPQFTLGNTGIGLNYQASVQFVNARTDQESLLPALRDNDRINLTRYQASASLSRTFYLWIGTTLPPTADQGLRYTPNPVLPYVAIGTGLRGTFNAYSNGDTQANLTGTVELSGQFGHFSRPFFDYTAFRIAYSQTALSGESPFLFDRVADEQVLSLGLTQQIYGPFRVGVQTSLNLDRDRTIDTIYTLEYSRRTYSISLNFSPIREAGSLTLRISDFNWFGDAGSFSGLNATPASNSVTPAAN